MSLPLLASAATITVFAPAHAVSGTAAISTIAGMKDGQRVVLHPTGLWTLVTGGNIFAAHTAGVDEPMELILKDGIIYRLGIAAGGGGGGAGVSSFNTRTGAVVGIQADYDGFFTTTAEAAAAAPVQSVHGRTGAVVGVQADYDAFFTTTAEASAAAPVQTVHGRSGAVVGLQADYDAFFTTTAEAAAAAPVQSVHGRTGAVVGLAADYDSFFLTPAEGDAAYVPVARQVATTGAAQGGGDLSADRTISVRGATTAQTGVTTLAADGGTLANTAVQGSDSRLAAIANKAEKATTISTTAPMTGGGDLSANRTFAVSEFIASGASAASGIVPAPSTTAGTTKFLREDKTWNVPAIPDITNVGGVSFYRCTGDVTNATTTLANVTGCVFTFVANAVYIIDLYPMCTSAAATTGYTFAFDVSVAVTRVGLNFYHQLANATGTLTGGSSIADATRTGLSSGVPSVSTLVVISGTGNLVAAGNGGTCQLQFAPEVAASATCLANTAIRVTRIL